MIRKRGGSFGAKNIPTLSQINQLHPPRVRSAHPKSLVVVVSQVENRLGNSSARNQTSNQAPVSSACVTNGDRKRKRKINARIVRERIKLVSA